MCRVTDDTCVADACVIHMFYTYNTHKDQTYIISVTQLGMYGRKLDFSSDRTLISFSLRSLLQLLANFILIYF